MSHIQFTRDTRLELAAYRATGKKNSECAKLLGMHRSSVLREIHRHADADGIYRGAHAHARARTKKKHAKETFKKIENNRKLRTYIVTKLKQCWSPEQIAGRLKRNNTTPIICHETIYQFIYQSRPDLVRYLRRQKNK